MKLCVSIDENILPDYIEHADYVKIHYDILKDNKQLIQKIPSNCIIIADEKYADIPFIIDKKLQQLPKSINIVTFHALIGNDGINMIKKNNKKGIIVANMSTGYKVSNEIIIQLCHEHKDTIIGYVSQHRIDELSYLEMYTPGISFNKQTDSIGQNYKSPLNIDTDIIIVGRDYYINPLKYTILTQTLIRNNESNIILKNGTTSNYYFNFGKITNVNIWTILATAIIEKIPKYNIQVVFGSAYKGIPLALELSRLLKCDYTFNRKEIKDHGEGGELLGAELYKKNILIVDDVYTSGQSLNQLKNIVTKYQGNIINSFVIINRSQNDNILSLFKF